LHVHEDEVETSGWNRINGLNSVGNQDHTMSVARKQLFDENPINLIIVGHENMTRGERFRIAIISRSRGRLCLEGRLGGMPIPVSEMSNRNREPSASGSRRIFTWVLLFRKRSV
jgi:hypothetical protein